MKAAAAAYTQPAAELPQTRQTSAAFLGANTVQEFEGARTMYIVTISNDADEERVFMSLSGIGHAWRPPYDIPRLVYVDGGSAELIASLPGVLSCHQGVGRKPSTADEHD